MPSSGLSGASRDKRFEGPRGTRRKSQHMALFSDILGLDLLIHAITLVTFLHITSIIIFFSELIAC